MLSLTIRKVHKLSRGSPSIPLLRLLLRDAVGAFGLIWGSGFRPAPDYCFADSFPSLVFLLLSEIFVIADRPVLHMIIIEYATTLPVTPLSDSFTFSPQLGRHSHILHSMF
jgi:hypothetical protein